MRKSLIILSVAIPLVVFLLCPGFLRASQDQVVNGSAQVELDFQINIPTILWLTVGSPGNTVDTIMFDIIDIPGSGVVQGVSTGANPVPVEVRGFVNPGDVMTLSVDSLTPLDDGAGNEIPFSEISWAGSDDFSSGRFGDIADQEIDQFTDSDEHTGTYTFFYDNDTYYPAAIYTGTVTYTLSSQ